MSWKAQHKKSYEARVVADSLRRLAIRFDVKAIALSEQELQTLAVRARESFRAYRSEGKKERLAKYKAHLSAIHGAGKVEPIWAALEEINNEIGYEEK